MKVLVCGSRGYASEAHYDALHDALGDLWPLDMIISGGCKNSADELAERYAAETGIKIKVYYADWMKHGKSAGFVRNGEMILENPSQVIAIWDGVSRGTEHTIRLAARHSIPVIIVPAKL